MFFFVYFPFYFWTPVVQLGASLVLIDKDFYEQSGVHLVTVRFGNIIYTRHHMMAWHTFNQATVNVDTGGIYSMLMLYMLLNTWHFIVSTMLVRDQYIHRYKQASGKYFCRVRWKYCNTNCSVSNIDGLVQERHNSIANALELGLPCTNPSICTDATPGQSVLSLLESDACVSKGLQNLDPSPWSSRRESLINLSNYK